MSKKHDFRMMMLRLPKLKGEEIKVEKTQDYYNFFSSILQVEDESIRDNRHYWVMGIDKAGYVVCVYIFSINPENLMKISLKKIFRVALMLDAVDIVLAYNVRTDESLLPSPENVAFFNKVFNLSDAVLELRTLDMMIISANGYHSDKEDGYLDFYTQDLSFKVVYNVKGRLDSLRKKYGRKKAFEAMEKGLLEGEHNKAVEMAKSMLADNMDISIISKHTGFTEEEINKFK